VLVGATIVGSIETVWHGVVNATRTRTVRDWHYPTGPVYSSGTSGSETIGTSAPTRLAQGAEMGRFALGSTVIVLMPPGSEPFAARWKPGAMVRLGEPMVGPRTTTGSPADKEMTCNATR
jgi:phosphatidylserine decarboxylase